MSKQPIRDSRVPVRDRAGNMVMADRPYPRGFLMSQRLLLAMSLMSMPLAAQALTFVEGDSAASLNVFVLPENKTGVDTNLLLEGIELLPIEMAGRRASQELETGIARRDQRQGFYRIELPGGRRLFEYRRNGGLTWGYLYVPANGEARVLLELPGIGAGGTGRPFADRISVDCEGRTMCVLAGGTIRVIRLDGTPFASTGTPVRIVPAPGVVVPMSLMVGATHVFFVTTNSRGWSVPLADGGVPLDITPTIAGRTPRMKDEIALSGNGQKAVFLYGANNDSMRFYMTDGTAVAAALPPPASKYEEPGYLPEGEGNLRLLLNHDATRLFYIDGQIRDESHLLDLTGGLGDLQITQDAIFQPYIGIHILPAFKGNVLIASIGDPDRMDWFAAELAPTGNTVTNLTGTGSLLQPFPPGALIPGKITIAGDTAIVTDLLPTDANRGTVRAIDLVANTSQVVTQELQGTPFAGSAVNGTPDLVVPGIGDRLFHGQTGSLVAQSPAGVRLTPPISASFYSVVEAELTQQWSVPVFYLPDGSMVFGPALQGLRQMVVSADDSLVLSLDSQSLWMANHQPTVALPIGPAPAVRVFLSGAGG